MHVSIILEIIVIVFWDYFNQIGLVDLLTTVGIKPSGLVGHSFGELGCAYADGCLTAEQTILSAYWRGQCIEDVGVVPGTMAAVGKDNVTT